MNSKILQWLLLTFLLGILSAFQLSGILQVPFHPDESTQLFMSADFEDWITRPLSLTWSSHSEDDLKQRYRELDAPLTRYILGMGRTITGLTAPVADWDWGKNWEINSQRGALPNEMLLLVGRLAVAILIPFSLLFTYLTGKQLGGRACGLLAMLFLGTNTIFLIHARRAMAEGALVFGISIFLWSVFKAGRFPWLAGLSAAVAFNAKQSAIALFPIGLIAVCWLAPVDRRNVAKATANILQYLLSFLLLTLALNPLYWSSPIQAVRASWAARQELSNRQASDFGAGISEPALGYPGTRVVALLANLYVLPPAFAEVSNYQRDTAPAEATYLARPGNNLLRGMAGGSVLLFLTVTGLVLAILRLRRACPGQRRILILLLLANLSQAAFILIAVPLPWQRYVIPLVPFVCIWSAYCLSTGLSLVFHSGTQLGAAFTALEMSREKT